MFSVLQDFFSNLNYMVGPQNPLGLGILFAMGVLTDVGMPLLLTLEIFLMFASYYVGPLSIPVLFMVLMLLLGRECGAAILYSISRLAGRPFLKWLQRHIPWFYKRVQILKPRVKKHLTVMVIIVRLTPGFLQIPSVISGSLGLPYLRFAVGVAASSLIYDIGLVLFGFIASKAIPNTSQNLRDIFIIVFIIIIVVMWLVLYFRFRNFFWPEDEGLNNKKGKRGKI